MLIEQLRTDLITAQKAKEATKVETLRMLISAIRNIAIDKYGGKARLHLPDARASGGQEDQATDEDVLGVVKKLAKQHQESITSFKQAGRNDLVEKEQAELDILALYLPAEAPDEEIEAVVKEIIASGTTDFGKVMGQAMGKLKGKASGDRVSAIVKKNLS